MEEQEKKSTAMPRSSDLRTFIIALLTTIIVLALYHFGMGYCRFMRGQMPPSGSCAQAGLPVQYVLMPVVAQPVAAPMIGQQPFHGPGFPARRHPQMNQDNPGPDPDGAAWNAPEDGAPQPQMDRPKPRKQGDGPKFTPPEDRNLQPMKPNRRQQPKKIQQARPEKKSEPAQANDGKTEVTPPPAPQAPAEVPPNA